MARETSTRYLGFCPVCERDIKVRSGLLVHHGYRRRGVGYIEGDCFGVGYPPHEVSDLLARKWQQVLTDMLVSTERDLRWLETTTELTVTKTRNVRVQHEGASQGYWTKEEYVETLHPGDRDWDYTLRMRKVNAQNRRDHLIEDVAKMQRLIDAWRPMPLRSVEEEISKAYQEREARQLAKTHAREEKIAQAVVRYQERIDSAVRRKNMRTLADIFSSAGAKLQQLSNHLLNRQAALRLLERDYVWRAFGLLTDEGYQTKEWTPHGEDRTPFELMRWEKIPWPAELN